jgi:hypothetical protein
VAVWLHLMRLHLMCLQGQQRMVPDLLLLLLLLLREQQHRHLCLMVCSCHQVPPLRAGLHQQQTPAAASSAA